MACLDTSFLIDLIRSGASARRRRATDKLREVLARGKHLTALVAGEPLVTANPTHFRNIPGLTVDTY